MKEVRTETVRNLRAEILKCWIPKQGTFRKGYELSDPARERSKEGVIMPKIEGVRGEVEHFVPTINSLWSPELPPATVSDRDE
jgi:hypothetical protein